MQAMTLRLPDDVHETLRREAYESRRSMNQVILDELSKNRAEIWNEGFWDGFNSDYPTKTPNPYRDGSK